MTFATARRFPRRTSCRRCRHRTGSAADSVEVVFNENVSKLNALLFTYLDYAAIGERL